MDANPYAPPKSGKSAAGPRRPLRAGHVALFGAALYLETWGVVGAMLVYMWYSAEFGWLDAADFERRHKTLIRLVNVSAYVQFVGLALAVGGFFKSETFQKAIARLRRNRPTPQK